MLYLEQEVRRPPQTQVPAQGAACTGEGEAAHAVVIGASIAGLTAARALARHFAQVTIVERDPLPAGGDFRDGVPQARHVHTLQPRGRLQLEQQFPGLTDELLAQGALLIDTRREVAVFEHGAWQEPPSGGARPLLAASRPLLEAALRRRLAVLPRVRILSGYQVVGLLTDGQQRRVRGVRLNRRGVLDGNSRLEAGLVLDASGRYSRAPAWLQELGHAPPEEWTISAHVGYATRVYERPERFEAAWQALYVRPSPPDGTRGGMIVPLEGGRWHVGLVGVAPDLPPNDEAGFLAFARSLPTGALYEAIREAQPLTRPFGYRRTSNRVRRYDRLPSYLQGFLVSGDAAYTLNPVYALGMTAAVAVGQTLEEALEAQPLTDGGCLSVDGLSRRFQQALSRNVAPLWRLSTRRDWGWPGTDVEDNLESELEPYLEVRNESD